MSAKFPATLAIQKTTQTQSKINLVYISPAIPRNESDMLFIDATYLFAVAADPSVPESHLALSKIQREYINKALGNGKTDVDFIDRKYIGNIGVIKFSIEMVNLATVELDAQELKDTIKTIYEGFPFNTQQRLYIEVPHKDSLGTSLILVLTVTEMVTDDRASYGILEDTTDVSLVSASARVSLTNNSLLKSNLSFEQLGIGGLKKEFEQMFRRAFVQRLFEPGLIKGFGISHVKGIMLYGPPGTGKTLIARQLGSLLNARAPKIVNGPEILNKYVGQSEENIRNLFKDAEDEFRAKREESQLHIIIFDEIDAICKKRGSSGSAGVGDQVVNQLLSKIDGVESLDNILVIGMTNRLDLIDEALLRPGRFEIHLEISLPDEASRHEIFMIHTKSMSTNNFLDAGVDLQRLAVLSKNYTGAEIAAVVRGAGSFALERQERIERESRERQDEAQAVAQDHSKIKVTMNDMIMALEETRPAFGVNEEEFENYNRVFYETSTSICAIELGKSMLAKLRKTNLYNTSSLLFYGTTGAGKTTLCVRIALQSMFPFIKIISPRHLVGLAEYEKVHYIKDCFLNAYKSEEACIILDDLEGLIEFVDIGPRFLNPILQAIKIFTKAEEKKKLFVFGTTSMPGVMQACGIFESFLESFEVGPCSEEDYEALCAQNARFKEAAFTEPVVIKKLLAMLPEADTSTK